MRTGRTDLSGILVAFDLDDTLFSERDFAVSGYEAAITLLDADDSMRRNATALMRKTLSEGRNPFDALEEFCATKQIPFPPIAKMLELYRFHTPQITLRPGMDELLSRLKTEGALLAIITDGRSRTQRTKFEALGLSEYFEPDNIYISEELGAEKTDPLVWTELEKKYPSAKKKYYIGDNPAKDFIQPNLRGWGSIMLADLNGTNIHPQRTCSCETAPDATAANAQEIYILLKDNK